MLQQNRPAVASSEGFLASMMLLSLLMGLVIGLSRVATTLLALDMDAHGWVLGAAASAQSIGMLVLGLPAGRWVAKYGVRPIFIAGTLWGAIVCVAIPLAPGLWTLIPLIAAASLAMPLRFVAINTLFMSGLEQVGRHHAGMFRACHIIGMSFLGALSATWLFPVIGPTAVFWIAAAMFLVNIPLLGRHLTCEYRPPANHSRQISFRSLLSSRQARDTALLEFSIQALNAYFAFYIVVIAIRYLGLAPQTAGIAVAVAGSIFVLTLILAGKTALRPGRSAPLAGSGLVLVSLVFLTVVGNAAELYAASAMLGLGLGLLQIVNLTRFVALGSRIGYASAASVNALSGPLGGAAGGAIGGMLEPWMSPQIAFLAFVPLVLLVAWRGEFGVSAATRSPT